LGPFYGAIQWSPLLRVVVVVVVVVVDIARRLRYCYSWRAPVATLGKWACGGSQTRSDECAQHFSNASCLIKFHSSSS